MLGKRIKEIRKSKGISQKKLSDECNVSISYIQQLEYGKKENPSIEILNKIATALDVSVMDILFDDLEVKDDLDESVEFIKYYLNDPESTDHPSYKNLGEDALQFLSVATGLLLKHLKESPKFLKCYSEIIEQISNYDKNLDSLYYEFVSEKLNPHMDPNKILEISSAITQQDRSLLNQIEKILPDLNDIFKEKHAFNFAVNNPREVNKILTEKKNGNEKIEDN